MTNSKIGKCYRLNYEVAYGTCLNTGRTKPEYVNLKAVMLNGNLIYTPTNIRPDNRWLDTDGFIKDVERFKGL